ncbi:MAG: desulfoferrodoxin [Verrucomicrobia bacterium]|nr:desulfoferrodoxin [Verrucomicrobiota bacterium]
MATKLLQVYKCNVCGNIVEVLHTGAGELVCCNEPMKLQSENTVDATKEKHVPIIEQVEGGVKVTVGSVPHPMTPEHWIEWIELLADGQACRRFLNPGDRPEAVFSIKAAKVSAREYCNLHGFWKA